MKKYITLLILASFGLVSCDDWLNKEPQATMTPSAFFKNEAGLQAFSNNFYLDFPGTGLYEERVDNITAQDLSYEMRGTRTIPASGSGWTWTALRDYNTLLEYSSYCEDAKAKEHYDALARFFRAYFYLGKVQRFGDVPWYDKPLGSADSDLYKPRDSRELVMQNIIADCDYAIEHLPATKDVYRVTKWTALALKSRICLFEGTFRKYHGIEYPEGKSWEWYLEQAAAASKEFIEMSGYLIYSADGAKNSYVNLFASDEAIATEIILARDYSKSLNIMHNASDYTLRFFPGVTKKIVDSYLMKDGTRFTDKAGWKTMEFKDEFKDRDPRLAQTVMTPGYTRIGGSDKLLPSFEGATATGYQLVKFVQNVAANAYTYDKSFNDLPIFRAAEVYLNYAEAKAELGTLTQGDIDMSIKKLRDRVGMPNLDMAAANAAPDPYLMAFETGYPNVKGANQGVILEIRRERTIELIQEGFRYYDMMRWREGKTFENKLLGMYIPALNTAIDLDGDGTGDLCIYDTAEKPSVTAKSFRKVDTDIYLIENPEGGYNVAPHKIMSQNWNEDRDYYYPIPTDERSLTNGAIKQNPGWNDGLDF